MAPRRDADVRDEPDESRVDLDLGSFDSTAARVSFLPTDRWALQVSAGRLRDVGTEFPFPDQNSITRVTASAVYHRPLRNNGIWATTVAYGRNYARQTVAGGLLDTPTGGALLESRVTLADRHTVFGRGEVGGMAAHHLHAHEFVAAVFDVGKVQVGYVRHVRARKGLQPGVGGSLALSVLPPALASRYAGRTAPSFGLFFSLQGARHQM